MPRKSECLKFRNAKGVGMHGISECLECRNALVLAAQGATENAFNCPGGPQSTHFYLSWRNPENLIFLVCLHAIRARPHSHLTKTPLKTTFLAAIFQEA